MKVQVTFYIVKYATIADYLYSSYTCTLVCGMCFSAISCKHWVAIPAWKQICIDWGPAIYKASCSILWYFSHWDKLVKLVINLRIQPLKNLTMYEWNWKEKRRLRICKSHIEGRNFSPVFAFVNYELFVNYLLIILTQVEITCDIISCIVETLFDFYLYIVLFQPTVLRHEQQWY